MKNSQSTSPSSLSVTIPLEKYQVMLDELKSLKQEVFEKGQEILGKELEILGNQQEIERLRWRLALQERLCWGRSSEKRRLPEDPSQLRICFEEVPLQADPLEEEVKAEKEAGKEAAYNRFRKSFKGKRVSHARKPIAQDIPRQKKVLEPEEDLQGAVRIGEEVTERYAVQPRLLYVEHLIRPRYKLPGGRIVIAPLPLMAHPRSNASESVLAHIAVAKYADHLPLNRQIEIFEREGIHLPASTVSNWMMAAAQCIEPVYNELRETLKESRYVQADETVHKVLESDKPGSLHQGYMWVFYIPHCNSPYIEYHPGRGSTALGTLLSGKTVIVQSDGYSAYEIFDKLKGKVHAGCWAHARRKFVEAELYDPPSSRYALDQIGKLYAVEKEIRQKELNKAEAVAIRQEKAYPVITGLEKWAVENLEKTPHDSPLDKAIRYMYKRFEQLSHYVNDADISIDNNAVERTIRPLTLNRKNSLFSGSHQAAHTAAIFFSLLGACRENNVDPYRWLMDCLTKVQDCNPKNYKHLLPHNWNK
ncbi:MAG: IS66 family transposase [Tannerella sp.]|jgi:transposase|nr:IS66 family transposase [Tannerella sp.]